MFDVRGVMLHLLDEQEYESWQNKMSQVVRCKHSNYWYSFYEKGTVQIEDSQCCGLSMFIPRKIYDDNASMKYNIVFKDTKWAQDVWGM